MQHVHFQVGVFNCQQIFTKISFVVFCAESKSLFELIIESVIVVADNFCCIHIFSAKFLICSQASNNLKHTCI